MSNAHVYNGLVHNYVQQIEDLGSIIYIGLAPMHSITSDPIWAIKRLSISGGAIGVQWADGNDLFDNVWDNRAALTYA